MRLFSVDAAVTDVGFEAPLTELIRALVEIQRDIEAMRFAAEV